MSSHFNRRDFHQGGPRGAAVAAAPKPHGHAGRVIGANDRVRIGCIGVGYRGVQVLKRSSRTRTPRSSPSATFMSRT